MSAHSARPWPRYGESAQRRALGADTPTGPGIKRIQVLRAIAKRPEKAQNSPTDGASERLTVSEQALRNLEVGILDSGEGIKALRRFNDALDCLSGNPSWERSLEPVWAEMAYNLESFNPIFTACMLKVQCTIGSSE